jgi:hypothetical protein
MGRRDWALSRWTADHPVSFPEPSGDAPAMPSVTRSQRGAVTARLRDRDADDLRGHARAFIAVYGRAAFEAVIAEL